MAELDKPVIELTGIGKVYSLDKVQVRALADVNLTIAAGEMLAIMGPSGSGKSTLMNIIGCLDQATEGRYLLRGLDVSKLNDNRLAEVRNREIGFVFQSFNLLPRISAVENVELPLIYAGAINSRRTRAVRALEAVGLGQRIRHKPNELSGGERQRVAIARALVNDPAIILADEPTGNLDSRSGAEVMRIFRRLNEEDGITVVFVTHDPDTAACTRRVVRLRDGRLTSDEPIPEEERLQAWHSIETTGSLHQVVADGVAG